MIKKLLLVLSALCLFTVHANYSAPVKITAVESLGDTILIHVSNPSAPGNPGGCTIGTSNPLALNTNGLDRHYSAVLTALVSNQDVELQVSSGACDGGARVVIAIKINSL